MTSYYSLRIYVSDDKFEIVDEILGIKSNNPPFWEFQRVEKDEDEYIPFVDYFLSILDGKFEHLKEIGIERNDITIWFIYAYDAQCNMEFLPEQMYKLGKEGIRLCISCYDVHDYDAEYDRTE
jgi:hypothetical protein